MFKTEATLSTITFVNQANTFVFFRLSNCYINFSIGYIMSMIKRVGFKSLSNKNCLCSCLLNNYKFPQSSYN